MLKNYIFCAFLFIAQWANAQLLTPYNVPLIVNGNALPLAWAGGLNNPQFSSIDLNGDAFMDLFVFDRNGGKVLTFVHSGIPNSTEWEYAPEYEAGFPIMGNWALLRDFNDDGVMDIFTNSYGGSLSGGIKLFRGSRDGSGRYSFKQMIFPNTSPISPDLIPFRLLGSTNYNRVTCINSDIPVVDDVDGDGDLDILSFEQSGSTIDLFENQAADLGLEDTVVYLRTEFCWGGISESDFDSGVNLAPVKGGCGNSGGLHAGSTLLTFDEDGDGNKDLVLGDQTSEYMVFLRNGGSLDTAWFTEVDNRFPSYDRSINMQIFNAAFYVDVNADGKRDLMAAPNVPLVAEDATCWYYQNIGTDAAPEFRYRQSDFLIDRMLDLGSGAQPAFADVNADGLLDIVVGNQGKYVTVDTTFSSLSLFLNTGTLANPAFELVDQDWLDFRQLSVGSIPSREFAPAFGDLDSDLDLDLLIGESNGRLYYIENTAGPNNPMVFNPSNRQTNYMGIDLDNSAVPQIVDLNRDGLNDIVVGTRSGRLRYFQNQGTLSNPMFTADGDAPNNYLLGNVSTTDPLVSPTRGYAAPFFIDFNGTFSLFTGSFSNSLQRYTDIENNIEGDFTLVENRIDGIDIGERSRPAIADIDGDGFLEFLVGNLRGGLSLYKSSLRIDGTVSSQSVSSFQAKVRVFPNPVVNDEVNIHIQYKKSLQEQVQYRLFDMHGRMLDAGQFNNEYNTLNTSDLSNGVYILQLTDRQGLLSKKFVVQRP